MTHTTQSSVDAVTLFRRFYPKFREVELEFIGLDEPHWSMDYNNNLKVKLAHRSNYSGAGVFKLHKLDVSMTFSCTFDSKRGSALVQLKSAFWNALCKEYLDGLRFFADIDLQPRSADSIEYLRKFLLKESAKISDPNLGVFLSSDRGEIPGLENRNCFVAGCWHFFIPKDSPEGKTLEAAIAVERAKEALAAQKQREQELRLAETTTADLQQVLEERLRAL